MSNRSHLEYLHVAPELGDQDDQRQSLHPEVPHCGRGYTAEVSGDHLKEPLLVGGVGQVPAPDGDILHQQR